MVEEARIMLHEAALNHDYMSIGINEDGEPVRGGFVPWERTASAFNMKTPKITLSKADLEDASVLQDLHDCKLLGVYIFVALTNYDFLKGFDDVLDLFICHGENIRDLSFVQGKEGLFMFYLEDARLADLRDLIKHLNVAKSNPINFVPGVCMGFYHCQVADTSALQDMTFINSELLIWPVEGDSKDRWPKGSNTRTYRYFG